MAYWWVAQGRTYRQERAGSYLWAPKKGKGDTTFFHWTNMTLIEPGDIIFSYLEKKISAVAIARTRAYSARRPSEVIAPWHLDGLRVDADYTDIQPPLVVSDFVDVLSLLLPVHHSPITRIGTGAQGYLFSLPSQAGRYLRDRLAPMGFIERLQEDAVAKAPMGETTRQAIISARRG